MYADHSDVAKVTSAGYNGVNAIVTASLLPNIHTIQSIALYKTLNPLILYICSVNIWSTDATAMLFRSAIPLRICRVPYCSEFNTLDVKLSFSLVGQRNLLKTVLPSSASSPKTAFYFLSISLKRMVLVYCSCKCLKSFTDWHEIHNG